MVKFNIESYMEKYEDKIDSSKVDPETFFKELAFNLDCINHLIKNNFISSDLIFLLEVKIKNRIKAVLIGE